MNFSNIFLPIWAFILKEKLKWASIYQLSCAYSEVMQVFLTSLLPATLSRSSRGNPRRSQARWDVFSLKCFRLDLWLSYLRDVHKKKIWRERPGDPDQRPEAPQLAIFNVKERHMKNACYLFVCTFLKAQRLRRVGAYSAEVSCVQSTGQGRGLRGNLELSW